MNLFLFIISWVLVGFLSVILIYIDDIRGKEFDPNYFKDSEGFYLGLILFGYISMIIFVFYYICDKKLFIKLIYKIANIGVKTQEKGD